jgi:hypothetical protein
MPWPEAFKLERPLKGTNQIYMSKLEKDYLRMLQTKIGDQILISFLGISFFNFCGL